MYGGHLNKVLISNACNQQHFLAFVMHATGPKRPQRMTQWNACNRQTVFCGLCDACNWSRKERKEWCNGPFSAEGPFTDQPWL